jgi:hypothetical protein
MNNVYKYDHILIADHMVDHMEHDYMVQNINEYIEDVYIYKYMAKIKKKHISFINKHSKPLCMVHINLYISFYIENVYNVFDIHVNMVDN